MMEDIKGSKTLKIPRFIAFVWVFANASMWAHSDCSINSRGRQHVWIYEYEVWREREWVPLLHLPLTN